MMVLFLPIAESGVEYQFDKLVGNLLAELFLHVGQHLVGIEVLIGRK